MVRVNDADGDVDQIGKSKEGFERESGVPDEVDPEICKKEWCREAQEGVGILGDRSNGQLPRGPGSGIEFEVGKVVERGEEVEHLVRNGDAAIPKRGEPIAMREAEEDSGDDTREDPGVDRIALVNEDT